MSPLSISKSTFGKYLLDCRETPKNKLFTFLGSVFFLLFIVYLIKIEQNITIEFLLYEEWFPQSSA